VRSAYGEFVNIVFIAELTNRSLFGDRKYTGRTTMTLRLTGTLQVRAVINE